MVYIQHCKYLSAAR